MTLVIAAMMLTVTGCKEKQPPIDPTYVAQLEQDNADLRAQIAALNKRVEEMELNAVLKDSILKAIPRDDGTGALVDVTAYPMAHREGQTAEISVRLNGEEVASTEAIWNGEAYTASFDLDAANGYGYYCVLVEDDGTRKQAVLSNVDNPVYDACVYLETSLNAYCTMYVGNWAQDGETLTINGVTIQVQLPRISKSENVGYAGSELVLKLNGEEIQRLGVELPEGEAKGSYELIQDSISFKMPEMEDDFALDLVLEVSLTDGNSLTYNSGSWYYNDGELFMVAG